MGMTHLLGRGVTLLRKADSPFLRSHELPIAQLVWFDLEQAFCRPPWLLWVHDCCSPARSRRHSFTAVPSDLWLLLYPPSSSLGPELWRERVWNACSIGAEHTTDTDPLHFGQLWVSTSTSGHDRKKLLWIGLRVALVSGLEMLI